MTTAAMIMAITRADIIPPMMAATGPSMVPPLCVCVCVCVCVYERERERERER